MSVLLITWGRFVVKDPKTELPIKITVPAPNTDPGKPYLWDYLLEQTPTLAKHFDGYQLPPASKCLGGNGAGCDGYGTFDIRDLGSKPQQGSTPTRYGTRDSFLQLIAKAHCSGMAVSLDLPLHQLMGENGGPGFFHYLGADNKTKNGRGTTTPGWFRGNTGNNDPVPPFCQEDAVPVPYYDFPFGREKSYQNCNPHRVTTEDAIDWGNWIFNKTGAEMARFDDTKGTWAPFVSEFMHSGVMAKKEFYSEFFDGNPHELNWWATSDPMNGRSGVEDFTTHWALQGACDGGQARVLSGGGYFNWRPDLSYVFVDNPDTDTSGGQQIISNKKMAYAYAMTIPCRRVLVYGKDYFPSSVWPGAYGLQHEIDNLCWINRKLAFGGYSVLYNDNSVFVCQRNGQGGSVGHSPGLVTALNFDNFNNRTVKVHTCFWPGTWLHDMTGNHPDITVDGSGDATMTLNKNVWNGGDSYACYTWGGTDQSSVRLAPRSITQMIEGDPALDVMPAKPEGQVVGKILCRKNEALELQLVQGGGCTFMVADPDNQVFLQQGRPLGEVPKDGEYTITAYSPAGVSNFKLNVTYHAE